MHHHKPFFVLKSTVSDQTEISCGAYTKSVDYVSISDSVRGFGLNPQDFKVVKSISLDADCWPNSFGLSRMGSFLLRASSSFGQRRSHT